VSGGRAGRVLRGGVRDPWLRGMRARRVGTRFEKIAIYAAGGVPTHAAKQTSDGRWKSKLGGWEDIEHNTPKAVESMCMEGGFIHASKGGCDIAILFCFSLCRAPKVDVRELLKGRV